MLEVIGHLFDIYETDFLALSNVPSRVAILLVDSQQSVKRLAMHLLAKFHRIYGDSMLVSLSLSFFHTRQIYCITEITKKKTEIFLQILRT